MEYAQSIGYFVKKCQNAGENLFAAMPCRFQIKVSYDRNASIPGFSHERGIILPEHYADEPLDNSRKYSIAKAVSKGMMNIKSNEPMSKVYRQSFERLSAVGWSNFLINKGVEGALSESGADRMIHNMGDLPAGIEYVEQKKKVPSAWRNKYRDSFESLLKFGKVPGNLSTNGLLDAYKNLLGQPEKAAALGVGAKDFRNLKTCVSDLDVPYIHQALRGIETLYDKQFLDFVKDWRPADLEKEISGLDPIPYFLRWGFTFGIPEDHAAAMSNSIKSTLNL